MPQKSVTMDWLMDDSIVKDCGVSLARMTMPVDIVSDAHLHTNCTETIHLLSGSVRQRIGEDWFDMHIGETCFVPINAIHQTENIGSDEAVLMIAYSKGRRIYISA